MGILGMVSRRWHGVGRAALLGVVEAVVVVLGLAPSAGAAGHHRPAEEAER